MIGQLSKYAFLNAKTRGMISRLLSCDDFRTCAERADLDDLWNRVRRAHPPDPDVSVPTQPVRAQGIEKYVRVNERRQLQRLIQVIPTAREKEFLEVYCERYEIERLKRLIRAWHKKEPVPSDRGILQQQFRGVDVAVLLASATIEEFILALEKTPYRRPLNGAREKFKLHGSVFFLEIALDIDYYRRVLDALARLSFSDRKAVRKLLGVEIDMENIHWLIRFKKYYAAGVDDILGWIIPGGDKVRKEEVRRHYAGELTSLMESVHAGGYPELKSFSPRNIHLVGQFLYAILMREARRVMSGFPFTIGTLLAYCVMVRWEAKNCVSLAYAIQYGWDSEMTKAVLIC
ncbi:MAG: hypothetical protein GF333_06190 [Candidatus Omnitrophica bacterium]|nr:hypothetical protein [Candidatus Omnitrophota bacterium]